MNDPHATRLVGLIWFLPLVLFFVPWAMQSLFKLGGKPVIEGKTIHFRLKPLMRATTWSLAASAAAVFWYGARTLSADTTSAVTMMICSVAILALAATCQGEIVLDDEGIHYHRAILRDCLVAWPDLNHFERKEVSNWRTQVSSTNYIFLGESGARVEANSMAFDVEDLLRCVQQRHACPEKSPNTRIRTMFKSPSIHRPKADRASRSDRH